MTPRKPIIDKANPTLAKTLALSTEIVEKAERVTEDIKLLRNTLIKRASVQGYRYEDIARLTGLTKARVGQIVQGKRHG